MKKKLLTIVFTSLVMILVLGGGTMFLYQKSEKVREAQEAAKAQELDIFLDNFEDNKENYDERVITELEDAKKGFSSKVVYNTMYTKTKEKEIEKSKKKNLYDFESPLFLWNPFGTNNLSMYLYFKTTEATYVKYTIQVENSNIPNFNRTLYNGQNDNVTREHEYQLMGFIPGEKNLLILQMYNKKGDLLNKKVFSIQVPALSSKADTKLNVSKGRSEEQISNGFYTIFGKKYIWLYDNSGVLRGEIPIAGETSQRILMQDGDMLYGLDEKRIAKVDSLGRVKEIYSLGKYKQYGDFVYNGYGELWILATKPGKKSKSVKDTVIALNLKENTVKKLFCMEELLPKMEKKAKKPKGTKEFNWVDLNAIVQVKSDEILVSSRELSTIFKVVDINSRSPRISYLIGEDEIWENLLYGKRLLKKEGQAEANEQQAEKQAESILDLGKAEDVFQSQFGQSWISYEKPSELSDGQYYIYVWDSNYGYSSTRKNFKWSTFSGIGTKNKDARRSYLKKYLVDENTATYNLVDTQELTYTKEQGSTQFFGEHRIDNYGNQKTFAEYDSVGRMIRKFTHNQKDVLRIEKMNMKGFLFY